MSYDEERLGELLRHRTRRTRRARCAEADAELRRRILADLEAAVAAEGVEPSSALLAELRTRLSPQ